MEYNPPQRRLSMFATQTMDRSKQPEQPVILPTETEPVDGKRKRAERFLFPLYQPVFDQITQKLVGHLSDISPTGFKLDSMIPIPLSQDFRYYLNPPSEIANKFCILLVARSRWCKVDPVDPFLYNVGYQLVSISPTDLQIFNRMLEKYGKKPEKVDYNYNSPNK